MANVQNSDSYSKSVEVSEYDYGRDNMCCAGSKDI
jgi:hypothetical protein